VSKSCNFLAGQGTRGQSTAMRGFKEDFMQWKSTLSSDEKAMLLRQTRGEFDKKYRKTEDFDKDLPEEKVEAFSKVLEKFFDSEVEDYVKQRDAKAPDYDRLKKKCAVKAYDWSLTHKIVEVDRDASRMEDMAEARMKAALAKGDKTLVPCGASYQEKWIMKNDDEESHKNNVALLAGFKTAMAESKKLDEAAKKMLAELSVPAMGEKWGLDVPEFWAHQIITAKEMSDKEKLSKADFMKAAEDLTKKYAGENQLLRQYASNLRELAKSETYVEGKTRGQWARELHEAIAEYNKKNKLDPPPPLDEEHIAELDKTPCTKPDDPEYRNPWQTAAKLYKSEAFDSFGSKYLLGIYDTPEQAVKVFEEWNVEYEKARAQLKEETIQWGKQEQARLDKDPAGQERVRKAVEEARR